MEQLFKSVLLLSCVGGVLTGILLLLKPLTQKAFGAHWQYCVWLGVFIVMVLPAHFTLPTPAAATQSTQAVQTVTQPAAEPLSVPVVQPQVQPVRTAATARIAPDILAALPYFWLFGVLLTFGWAVLRYLLFLQITRKNSKPALCPEADSIKADLNIRRTVYIRVTDCTTAPLMVGLFRATLLLPNRATSAEGLSHILHHELTHLKRHDIACKWFALLVRCVHWFNPLVYIACKQMDEECENACDSAVTGDMDEGGKRGYMRTILSLASPPKTLPLATSMAGEKKQIERRFTMIQRGKKTSRLVRALSVMVAIALLVTSVFAGGVAASAVGIGTGEKTVIEVYNDTTKLSFTGKPFIENYEVYLPVRETLNQFGITDIQWSDGKIDIVLPLLDHYKGFAVQETACQITIGSAQFKCPSTGMEDSSIGYPLKNAPIIRDGVTYAAVDFFEELITRGQIPRFRIHLIQSSDPKDYYTADEEVFVGTGAEQDKYRPVDENGNKRYVKRIVTNEKGEAMFVVTAENQKPEIIAARSKTSTASMEGFSDVGVRTISYNAYGELVTHATGMFVYERTGEQFTDIAYIPPTLQINCCAYNYPAAKTGTP